MKNKIMNGILRSQARVAVSQRSKSIEASNVSRKPAGSWPNAASTIACELTRSSSKRPCTTSRDRHGPRQLASLRLISKNWELPSAKRFRVRTFSFERKMKQPN